MNLKTRSNCPTFKSLALCVAITSYGFSTSASAIDLTEGTQSQYEQLLSLYVQLFQLNETLQQTEPPMGPEGPQGDAGPQGETGPDGFAGLAIPEATILDLSAEMDEREDYIERIENATGAMVNRVEAVQALLDRLSADADELGAEI